MIQFVPADSDDVAFVLPHKNTITPLTYQKYQKFFTHCIRKIGLDPSEYSSHSFRRGGASLAFQLNIPSEIIQFTGDWQSDCYMRYLDIDFDSKCLVSKTIKDYIYNKFLYR